MSAPVVTKKGIGYEIEVDGKIVGFTEVQVAFGAGYGTWTTYATGMLDEAWENDGDTGVWITGTRKQGIALLLAFVEDPGPEV